MTSFVQRSSSVLADPGHMVIASAARIRQRSRAARLAYTMFLMLAAGLTSAQEQARANDGRAWGFADGEFATLDDAALLRHVDWPKHQTAIRLAALAGDTHAAYLVGASLAQGRHAQLGQSLHWFQRAATAGGPPRAVVALYTYGVTLAKTSQTLADNAQADEAIWSAAQRQYAPAQEYVVRALLDKPDAFLVQREETRARLKAQHSLAEAASSSGPVRVPPDAAYVAEWRVCRAVLPPSDGTVFWVLSEPFDVAKAPDWRSQLQTARPFESALSQLTDMDTDEAVVVCSGPRFQLDGAVRDRGVLRSKLEQESAPGVKLVMGTWHWQPSAARQSP